MVKKELIMKALSIVIDLSASFLLPLVSDKLKEGFDKKERRQMIKEEIQSYLEAH